MNLYENIDNSALNNDALDTHSLYLNSLCNSEIINACKLGPDLLPGSEQEALLIKPVLVKQGLIESYPQHMPSQQVLKVIHEKPVSFDITLLPQNLLFYANQAYISWACKLIVTLSTEPKNPEERLEGEKEETEEREEKETGQQLPSGNNLPAENPGGMVTKMKIKNVSVKF